MAEENGRKNPEKEITLKINYLTQKEVAQRFRVTETTIKNWREQGKLAYLRAPGSTRVLYPIESIEEFERRYTTPAKTKPKPADIIVKSSAMSSRTKETWRI
jgi:hypothetical protein